MGMHAEILSKHEIAPPTAELGAMTYLRWGNPK